MAARRPGSFQFLCACTASAATPATCGVAMEVPDSYVPPVLVPMLVENTFTPGADKLGFRAPSRLRGPPELKEAASLKPASGTFAGAIDALTGDGAARKVPVSLSSSSMNGIVATSIIGSKNPAALLTTPIAAAP